MRRRLIRVAIVGLLLAPVVASGGFARGLSISDFSGFDMSAKGTAALFVFDSPSLGIPAHPTGELNFAYSEAVLQSGPSAYALGSILWPGQVAAALPPFLQDTIETEAGQEFFPVDLPAYPVRAESFHPQGPATASFDTGTVHMRSTAREVSAEGVAYMNRFVLPFIASMGNQSSFSQAGFDNDGAVSIVEAAVNDVLLLNGLIRIDSVVSRAAARSDGEDGSVAGATTIGGARITGVGDVIIDTEGVHVAEQGIGAAAAQQVLDQVLNGLGISIRLSEPIDTVQGPSASRALGGVVISIESSTIEPLISALPDELEREIRGQVTFDQTISVQLAPAAASAVAVKALGFVVDESPPLVGDVGAGAPAAPIEVPVGNGTGLAPPVGAPPVADMGGPAGGVTVTSSFEGVPVWLVVLLLLAAFALSRPLTAWADRILSARAGATTCPEAT